jgi:hypothetical protein
MFQYIEHVFKLRDHLVNQLLVLRAVFFLVVARESLSRAADGKALIIKKRSNLANHQDILTLVIASIATSFYGFKLRKHVLPIKQYMRLYCTQTADFTYGEIAFSRNRR